MIKTLLGTKLNMTARFQEENRIPVTLIAASPNVVISIRDSKIQLGLGRKKKIKKTENAYVKAAGFAPKYVREVSIEKNDEQASVEQKKISVGDKITVAIFSPGDIVKVTGTTKGRGFAGGVKRWGFHGGPKTHGQSDRHRAPGSIGQATTPGRVFKGKKMAGHMGVDRLTLRGLQVIEVDENKNLLVVKGAVPGARNGFVIVEKIGRLKNYKAETPKEEEKAMVANEQNQDTTQASKTTDKQDTQNEEILVIEETVQKATESKENIGEEKDG